MGLAGTTGCGRGATGLALMGSDAEGRGGDGQVRRDASPGA